MLSVSEAGGATFSQPKVISTGGPSGTPNNQGADIAVGPDGAIYVAYNAVERSTGANSISIVKSTDCGRKWSQPVVVGQVVAGQAPGVAFRTPTFAFVSADDTNANVVYVAYQSFAGDYDIYVQRSTTGGATWGRQFKPTRTRARGIRSSRRWTWPTVPCTWRGSTSATA